MLPSFSKTDLTFCLFLCMHLLGVILINSQEMDFIELNKMSFSKLERSRLVHFHIILYCFIDDTLILSRRIMELSHAESR